MKKIFLFNLWRVGAGQPYLPVSKDPDERRGGEEFVEDAGLQVGLASVEPLAPPAAGEHQPERVLCLDGFLQPGGYNVP